MKLFSHQRYSIIGNNELGGFCSLWSEQGSVMARMRVIVVGGFLGSGKTTLLAQAARHFAEQHKRIAIITNDQAGHLVDTHFLKSLNVIVGEVAGGCFCCRFEDLENAATRLFSDTCPDVLLTEPVGSCTDISATVLQPMKQLWGEWADVSPFSVLADPHRLRRTLDENSAFPESVRYIIKKQFEEADYIVINKTDLISPEEMAKLRDKVTSTWSGTRVFEISALRDSGVTEWLEAVLNVRGGGNKIIEVDYDAYAQGEAELGWLNTSFLLTAPAPKDWNALGLDVARRIQTELASLSAEIGHLKLLLANSTSQFIVNSTGIHEDLTTQGSIGNHPGELEFVLNVRAHISPDQLKAIVGRSILAAAGETVEISNLSLSSFSPAYPRPTHRIDKVV
jgi:Ni2+-binding GTPase involved in maturation of urease and hydrogenase